MTLVITPNVDRTAAVLALSLDMPHGPLAAGGGAFTLLLRSGPAALQYLRPSG
ncbi:hypothetical protein FHX37_3794 [Haloactinospora alba]|uniref:Uncharacterized protein n=1 Tax=Haloactinospora alba TaxID=405555 RepID=A0A543N9H3_9ACTN|nr:hypothetical protein [Haloactinospora alba]TQN28449.1 hypothetical protein FHX37_3794 [Haloactinospora alba]